MLRDLWGGKYHSKHVQEWSNAQDILTCRDHQYDYVANTQRVWRSPSLTLNYIGVKQWHYYATGEVEEKRYITSPRACNRE